MSGIEALAPVDYLVDAVIDFLAALSPRDFAAIVAQARPPESRVSKVLEETLSRGYPGQACDRGGVA